MTNKKFYDSPYHYRFHNYFPNILADKYSDTCFVWEHILHASYKEHVNNNQSPYLEIVTENIEYTELKIYLRYISKYIHD